jgi:hypothetical protein
MMEALDYVQKMETDVIGESLRRYTKELRGKAEHMRENAYFRDFACKYTAKLDQLLES